MSKKGIFAGTFDPVTKGHLDIIKRSLKIVDFLVIAIYKNPEKNTLLDIGQRSALMHSEIETNFLSDSVKIIEFETLLAEVVRQEGITVNIRGVRSFKDYEYESTMHCINNKLLNLFETIFFPSSNGFEHISSSAVREIAALKGDLSMFVSKSTEKLMREIYFSEKKVNS